MSARLRGFCMVPLIVCGAFFQTAVLSQETKKKPENIILKDGAAKVDRALKEDDDLDPVKKMRCKVFTVALQSGRNYRIDMTSRQVDALLRLEGADGKELAQDDDSGGFPDARINFSCPKDDTYRVICTSFKAGMGAFTLAVQEFPLAKAGEDLILKDGAAKSEGKLAAQDPKDWVQAQSPCKIYAVKLSKGKSYQIDMISKELDSFLRLEDAAGKQLAFNDDGGDGNDSRIQFQCPADETYRIIATTYYGGIGSFAVAIKEK